MEAVLCSWSAQPPRLKAFSSCLIFPGLKAGASTVAPLGGA
jgi:hypothetical protein